MPWSTALRIARVRIFDSFDGFDDRASSVSVPSSSRVTFFAAHVGFRAAAFSVLSSKNSRANSSSSLAMCSTHRRVLLTRAEASRVGRE
ncbi:MAG: hypothetical protein ABUL62_34410 [Myxococcales bacterium]|jgi:hypothetical protein